MRPSLEMIKVPLHEALLGISEAIVRINDMVRRMAPTRLTVLVTGESGTGKDIVARVLHRQSPRAEKPFIKVNCPAVPESIFESELFGYEKGAFTGAQSSKPGRLELAHTGTLFLDEITEISHAVQGKLLQMLDGEPILRVGGVQPISCDVRIVAATNMNIDDAVAAGRIRRELYFRLMEAHIHIPPLRERREDIPVLAEHFNFNFRQKFGRSYEPLPDEYLEKMCTLDWPGNVRELAACVRKYVATGVSDALFGDPRETVAARPEPVIPTALVPPVPPVRLPAINIPHLSDEATGSEQAYPTPSPEARKDKPPAKVTQPQRKLMSLKEARKIAIEKAEKALIEEALRITLWNRRKAAKLLGISYSSILRRIEAYNIGEHNAEGEPSE